jgi:two-component system, cell cycle response regulator DivK
MRNSDKERRRILLVEDHEDAWEIAAYILEEYKLFHARDFAEGLRLARRRYFDLYILDNWLPDRSGVELCRAIREFDPHTPILFYSAAAYESDKREALRAGAQEYFVKPVIFDELKQTVARLISAAREKAFEARRAAMDAVREELAIQRMETAELREKARENRSRAKEKKLRVRAQIAFLAAGGARGDFAREWSSVRSEEARSALMSDVDEHEHQKIGEAER